MAALPDHKHVVPRVTRSAPRLHRVGRRVTPNGNGGREDELHDVLAPAPDAPSARDRTAQLPSGPVGRVKDMRPTRSAQPQVVLIRREASPAGRHATTVAEKRLLSAKAVQRAKQRLVDGHREEYGVLLNHERNRLGLEHIRARRWNDGQPTTDDADGPARAAPFQVDQPRPVIS